MPQTSYNGNISVLQYPSVGGRNPIATYNIFFFLCAFFNRRSFEILDCFTGLSPGTGRNELAISIPVVRLALGGGLPKIYFLCLICGSQMTFSFLRIRGNRCKNYWIPCSATFGSGRVGAEHSRVCGLTTETPSTGKFMTWKTHRVASVIITKIENASMYCCATIFPAKI